MTLSRPSALYECFGWSVAASGWLDAEPMLIGSGLTLRASKSTSQAEPVSRLVLAQFGLSLRFSASTGSLP